MARYRLSFDVETKDPEITERALAQITKEAEQYTKVVLMADIDIDKSADSVRSVHKHHSTSRRSCQFCVDNLADDQNTSDDVE